MNVSAPKFKFDQKPKSKKRARSMDMAELVEALEASVAQPTRIPNEDDEIESDYEYDDDDDNYYDYTPIDQEYERQVSKKRDTRVVEESLVKPSRVLPVPNIRRYKKTDKRRIDARKRLARFYASAEDVEMSADGLNY